MRLDILFIPGNLVIDIVDPGCHGFDMFLELFKIIRCGLKLGRNIIPSLFGAHEVPISTINGRLKGRKFLLSFLLDDTCVHFFFL